MTTYLFNCHKCTNKLINVQGEEYCRPMVEGKKACYLQSGDCGKNFVFDCSEYMTEPQQMEIYEVIKK